MNLNELEKVIQRSWSKETSYTPEDWTILNSSIGQCAVTALIVNDYLGGDIIWSEVLLPNGQKVSHYFNFIGGKEIDLTRSQFPKDSIIPRGIEKKKGFATPREFMLSNSNTKRRYDLLKEIVRNNLAD
jgi:hypothetical protein